MPRRPAHRLTIALAVVLSLLLAQFAVAGCVCPQAAGADAMAAMMQAGQPCEGMDPQQPARCHPASADPVKAFEAVKLPTIGQPAIVQVIERPVLPPLQPARAVAASTASGRWRPPPDPLFLSTLRLRI